MIIGPNRNSRWEIARRCVALTVIAALAVPSTMFGADETEIAASALDFGGSIGKLLWVSVKDHEMVTQSQANQYTKLAAAIKEKIDEGRLSSSLIKTNFNVVGTTLAYSAAVDPEPVSKAVAGVAAWGAKKTGDAIGQMVVGQFQQQARAILAQGLQNSGLSDAQLRNMTAAELRAKVSDLKIGGQTLRDILKDDQDSLNMLQANAADIATQIGVEAIARSEVTAADVKTVKQELANTKKDLADFQDKVSQHLGTVETNISDVQNATRLANQKLDALKDKVQGQSKAIQTLAQISYSGWTTGQKLQAVESGLFPDLTDSQKAALIDSLKADESREEAVDNLQQAASDFGNLAGIASHIGLPKDVVTGLQGAQSIATGIAHFATGDVLGGLNSLTSIVGLGAPDAEATRYKAMMQYLEQKFEQINVKLDEVISLQVQTLKAVEALSKEQQQFRREVLGQLDRIEDTVLTSERDLQALLLSQWTDCRYVINSKPLNSQFTIPTRDVLVAVVGNVETRTHAAACYSKMDGFLVDYVKSAKWSGQVIDAGNFPTNDIPASSGLQKAWKAFQSQRTNAYESARDFVLEDLSDASSTPAVHLARFSQPVVDTYFASKLDSALGEVHEQLASFKCNQTGILSPQLTELLCVGLVDGDPNPPLNSRWRELLEAALIGPLSTTLVETGMTLSKIVDFAVRDDRGSYTFVDPMTIKNFWRDGAGGQLQSALGQHKGLELLEKLRWLTEASVLQQSVTYGDYTAQLAERVLYDSKSKSLTTDSPTKQKALAAMRTNPVLARNVVMLAMRHAIKDSLGGVDKAESVRYRQTYYALALSEFKGSQACDSSILPRQKLEELFPNWKFRYWVTSDEKQKDQKLSEQDQQFRDCAAEYQPDQNSSSLQFPARGAGVGVSVADDLYVLVPSPIVLSTGVFEQSDSLRFALAYRDRLSQAIIDRNVASTIRDISGGATDSNIAAASTAFAVLNEGWGWQTRKKSK